MSEEPRANDPMQIQAITVYTGRPLTDEERAANELHDRGDALPKFIDADPVLKHDLTDKEIEADENRIRLQLNEAHICLSIEAGQEFGEVIVLVQHEGKKAEEKFGPQKQLEIRNRCMEGQNALLRDVTQWLKELFGETAANWKVKIDAEPCPHASVPYEIFETAKLLGEVPMLARKAALDLPGTQDVQINPSNE